ncbi:RNA polymerase sigma factor [Nocardioides zeicaulis]|uniref:RNA polymerase sigma factor n=1 Tax=Nocardioides zeicaulis TaxID=1776857 RepID=A0ABV6E3J8_9ACTN
MTVVRLPARSGPRYGGRVVGATVFEETPEEESVEGLALRFRDGDELALGRVFDRWSALVHTYALRSLGDTHDAEDVTQQVFVAAWRSRATLTPSPSTFPAWLLGIARHKVADARAARARDARKVHAVAAVTTPDDAVAADDAALADRLVVRQLVDEMDEPRRTVLLLAFWGDQPHSDIAATTGLPLGTVKSHLRRGLAQLHRVLEEVRHGPR